MFDLVYVQVCLHDVVLIPFVGNAKLVVSIGARCERRSPCVIGLLPPVEGNSPQYSTPQPTAQGRARILSLPMRYCLAMGIPRCPMLHEGGMRRDVHYLHDFTVFTL